MYDIKVKAYLGEPGNRTNFVISFPCEISFHSFDYSFRGLHTTLHNAVRIQLGDWIDFDYWYLLDDRCIRLRNPFTRWLGRMANRDFRKKLDWDGEKVLEIWLQKHSPVINYISTNWYWSPVFCRRCCRYHISMCCRESCSPRRRCTFRSSDIVYWKFEIRSRTPNFPFVPNYSFGLQSVWYLDDGIIDRNWCGWTFDVNQDSEIFEIVYHGPEDMMILYRNGIEYGFKKLWNDGKPIMGRCTPVVSYPPGTMCILLGTKRHFPTLQQLCMWKINRVVKKKDNHSQNVVSLPLPKLLKAKLSMKAI
jgi:hypothetical protein